MAHFASLSPRKFAAVRSRVTDPARTRQARESAVTHLARSRQASGGCKLEALHMLATRTPLMAVALDPAAAAAGSWVRGLWPELAAAVTVPVAAALRPAVDAVRRFAAAHGVSRRGFAPLCLPGETKNSVARAKAGSENRDQPRGCVIGASAEPAADYQIKAADHQIKLEHGLNNSTCRFQHNHDSVHGYHQDFYDSVDRRQLLLMRPASASTARAQPRFGHDRSHGNVAGSASTILEAKRPQSAPVSRKPPVITSSMANQLERETVIVRNPRRVPPRPPGPGRYGDSNARRRSSAEAAAAVSAGEHSSPANQNGFDEAMIEVEQCQATTFEKGISSEIQNNFQLHHQNAHQSLCKPGSSGHDSRLKFRERKSQVVSKIGVSSTSLWIKPRAADSRAGRLTLGVRTKGHESSEVTQATASLAEALERARDDALALARDMEAGRAALLHGGSGAGEAQRLLASRRQTKLSGNRQEVRETITSMMQGC